MKTQRHQKRFYRQWIKARDLHLCLIADQQTDLQILTDKKPNKEFIRQRIRNYRWNIENYIAKENRFLTSLKPIPVELNAPAIVKAMAQAAKSANVGPMAAVAGAIAQFLGRDLLRRGYKEVIIENGGDLFLKTKKPRRIGIYAGKAKAWNRLSLIVNPEDTPLGICTSSGTLGHSLSFGCADNVIIFARNSALADATATACGNLVRSKEDLPKAVAFAKSVKGILGIVVVLKNDFISWGEKLKFLIHRRKNKKLLK